MVLCSSLFFLDYKVTFFRAHPKWLHFQGFQGTTLYSRASNSAAASLNTLFWILCCSAEKCTTIPKTAFSTVCIGMERTVQITL